MSTPLVSTRSKLALLDALTIAVPGVPFDVDLDPADGVADIATWCAAKGTHHISVEPLATGRLRHRLRVGLGGDPIDDLPPERRPGGRLWIYTNFHCNLACDYCCVSSSPTAPRRAIPTDVVERLAREAADLGTREIFLTGGEPFLRSDIAHLVTTCASVAPTTVLTNAMLFRGTRLEWLDKCPRDRVTLQISLDSANPRLHDRHRGLGSHAAALNGITTAREHDFRVRIAATVGPSDHHEERALHALCDDLGLGPDDRVIRRIAAQGMAESGIRISRTSILPEICITAEGVWWHPVGATDPALQITADIPPLADIVADVTDEYRRHRADTDLVAAAFPCG